VRRNRFLYLILALMLLLNVALLAFAWQALSSRRAGSAGSVESAGDAAKTGAANSALAAYALAEPVAINWAADAVLLRVRGDWPEGSFQPHLDSWAFVFYSADRGAIAQINAHGDRAQLISTGAANDALAPVPVSEWQVDSDAIVETFLGGAGGDLFLDERTSVSMVLSLSLSDSASWTATLVDWETGDLLRRDFDAGSGYLTAGY
jgi:hypothetical protein